MDIRVLRYFLTVCDAGTMSRAAELLHITQPALSRQISALERELGTTLLERGSRHVSPTESGLYLRRRAQEIIALADQTEADFARASELVEGDVHIGAGESEGMRVVAAQIRTFRERYHDVRFHIHSGNAPDILERLERGLDDFAVLMSHPNIDRYAHIRLRPTDAWCATMRADDPLASRETVGPEDLATTPIIVPERYYRDGHIAGELASWFGDRAPAPEIAATVNLAFNGSMLVREGVGRMLAFDGLVGTGPETGLTSRLLFPPLVSVIDVAWKRDAPLGNAAARFLDFMREGHEAERAPAES